MKSQYKLKILFIGNQLSKHGFTPTSVDTLGVKLKEVYKVIRGSSIPHPIFRLFHMWLLVLKNRNANYLLIDTYSTSAFFFAWTSARIAGWFNLKYIPILHGGSLPRRAKQSPNIMKRYLSKAFKVVCPSNYLKEAMEKVIERDFQVIPNYINIKNYPLVEKAINKEEGIKLLWVRSFHKIYNPCMAIDVLKKLTAKGFTNTQLCMVGPDKDGSMVKAQEYAKMLGVDNFVTFTGRLSKGDWIALSKKYNIFINTTNVDNTPVSVIEAMALGFPVITTNPGGIPFLFENGKEGVMINCGDSDMMVDEITNLAKDIEKYIMLSSNARKKAEEFAWENVKLKWNNILES
ncbi:glycosyltransferase family 4 protein [Flexithrix dorotheae]|uniref:glycosyltransferase family 4 protein n=1 Tax=Flexithrix dorotheae TaxID=70993 RepID=UPI00036C742F|nr:glycosyltransferase family 4 protein [Flexithrix dorotheae]